MTLENYMSDYLGGLETQLGWSTSGSSYDFAVSETLRIYGVDNESDATDTDKLYTIARYVLWGCVVREISFDYDYSTNGASYKRSQMYDTVKQNLTDAETDAMPYLANYQIVLGKTGNEAHDPYSNYPYIDRYL